MAWREEDTAATVEGDVVELTVPAEPAYLAVVRTATAGLAARLRFSTDEIEDLRAAVDEACALLLGLPPAADEPSLTCRFDMHDDGLTVVVAAPAAAGAQLPSTSFAWQVLTAYASDVAGTARDGTATIALTKYRARR
ncbi:anti-sigma regulatory factor [Luedemannella helvata]|uniref:Anti-sigma regulatory factor n=1 Tax=Luedemannella helvata TaxID=349315 RepID=A0ABN2L3C5_9ACTN